MVKDGQITIHVAKSESWTHNVGGVGDVSAQFDRSLGAEIRIQVTASWRLSKLQSRALFHLATALVCLELIHRHGIPGIYSSAQQRPARAEAKFSQRRRRHSGGGVRLIQPT